MYCYICTEDEPLEECSICGKEICCECREDDPETVCEECSEEVFDMIEESR